MRKYLKHTLIVLMVAIPLLWLWRHFQTETSPATKSGPAVTPGTSASSPTGQASVASDRKTKKDKEGTFPFIWQLLPDGTIPVGQESATVPVPKDCNTDMQVAHDSPDWEMWIQPQFTRKWVRHDGKTRYSASFIKIKSMSEGNVPPTYTVTDCK